MKEIFIEVILCIFKICFRLLYIVERFMAVMNNRGFIWKVYLVFLVHMLFKIRALPIKRTYFYSPTTITNINKTLECVWVSTSKSASIIYLEPMQLCRFSLCDGWYIYTSDSEQLRFGPPRQMTPCGCWRSHMAVYYCIYTVANASNT